MASEDVVWEKQLTRKPRRSKRLRALRSQYGDADARATDTEDEQPLSHKPHVDVEPVLSLAPSPPNEVIRALEEDLLDHPRARYGVQEGCFGPRRFTRDISFSARQGGTQFDATQFSDQPGSGWERWDGGV